MATRLRRSVKVVVDVPGSERVTIDNLDIKFSGILSASSFSEMTIEIYNAKLATRNAIEAANANIQLYVGNGQIEPWILFTGISYFSSSTLQRPDFVTTIQARGATFKARRDYSHSQEKGTSYRSLLTKIAQDCVSENLRALEESGKATDALREARRLNVYISDSLKERELKRPFVFDSGTCFSALSQALKIGDLVYSIVNNQMIIAPRGVSNIGLNTQDSAPVISAESGLTESPKINSDSVEFETSLSPGLVPYYWVYLNPKYWTNLIPPALYERYTDLLGGETGRFSDIPEDQAKGYHQIKEVHVTGGNFGESFDAKVTTMSRYGQPKLPDKV